MGPPDCPQSRWNNGRPLGGPNSHELEPKQNHPLSLARPLLETESEAFRSLVFPSLSLVFCRNPRIEHGERSRPRAGAREPRTVYLPAPSAVVQLLDSLIVGIVCMVTEAFSPPAIPPFSGPSFATISCCWFAQKGSSLLARVFGVWPDQARPVQAQ